VTRAAANDYRDRRRRRRRLSRAQSWHKK